MPLLPQDTAHLWPWVLVFVNSQMFHYSCVHYKFGVFLVAFDNKGIKKMSKIPFRGQFKICSPSLTYICMSAALCRPFACPGSLVTAQLQGAPCAQCDGNVTMHSVVARQPCSTCRGQRNFYSWISLLLKLGGWLLKNEQHGHVLAFVFYKSKRLESQV